MTDDITKDMTTDDKLDFLINAVSDIRQRQVGLEELVHARLTDTRPLWESVNVRLEAIEQRLTNLEQGQQRHDERFDRLENILEIFNEDLMNFRGRQRQLEKRVTELEKAA